MNIGSAEASKNSRKTKRFVQAKLPTRQISDISKSPVSKYLLTSEYHAVKSAIISTAVLRITKGRLRLW